MTDLGILEINELDNQVYDFKIKGHVDIKTLSRTELHTLLNQYAVYDAYMSRILDELNSRFVAGARNDR